MPERNAVEIAEHGDQPRPNCPEHDTEQPKHQQHGNTQRLLVNLLQRNGGFFWRLAPSAPYLSNDSADAPVHDARRYAAAPLRFAAQYRLVQQVPDDHQQTVSIQRPGEAQGGQRNRDNRLSTVMVTSRMVCDFFITPAFAAHRPLTVKAISSC